MAASFHPIRATSREYDGLSAFIRFVNYFGEHVLYSAGLQQLKRHVGSVICGQDTFDRFLMKANRLYGVGWVSILLALFICR